MSVDSWLCFFSAVHPPSFVKEIEEVRHRFIDQDVMNKYCVPDKVVSLPVRFNECSCCGMTDNPAIVHYAGCNSWFNNKYIHRAEYLAKYL